MTELLAGRYALHGKLAAGGMATIHLGCTVGAVGFARAVVIKRLLQQHVDDRDFVAMFVDEARLAARIRHPNVIPTLDVVAEAGELFLVMEYVHGESLGRLLANAVRADETIPPSIVSAVGIGVLEGLHAAHEATDERGQPMHLVHRDVSPQNVLIGIDGIARVLDFGIAKAQSRIHETNHGELKGKMAYMAPEQIHGGPLDRRTDVFACGVVLWELATRRRLFVGSQAADYLDAILKDEIPPPSKYAPDCKPIDAVILRALERDPAKRYPTAREFALALEDALEPAAPRVVGQWVSASAKATLDERAELVKAVEGVATDPNSVRRQIDEIERANVSTEVSTPIVPLAPVTAIIDPTITKTSFSLADAKMGTPLMAGAPVPPVPSPSTRPPGFASTAPPAQPRRSFGTIALSALAVVAIGVAAFVVYDARVRRPPVPARADPVPAETASTTAVATTSSTADTKEVASSIPPPSASTSASAPVATTKASGGRKVPHVPALRSREPSTTATAPPAPVDSLDMGSRK